MNENKNCVCPKCSSSGESVAAIHYNQTQVWDKDGTFSGVGVGLTTSGPGIGLGVGNYYEEGVTQTKIAKTFDEPKRANNLGSVLLILGIILVGIVSAPSVLSGMSNVSHVPVSSNSLSFDKLINSDLNRVMFSIMPILFIGLAIRVIFKTINKDDNYNAKVYPEKVKRFNELRYCKNCNIIFDYNGNYENASEDGYSKMLCR